MEINILIVKRTKRQRAEEHYEKFSAVDPMGFHLLIWHIGDFLEEGKDLSKERNMGEQNKSRQNQ